MEHCKLSIPQIIESLWLHLAEDDNETPDYLTMCLKWEFMQIEVLQILTVLKLVVNPIIAEFNGSHCVLFGAEVCCVKTSP